LARYRDDWEFVGMVLAESILHVINDGRERSAFVVAKLRAEEIEHETEKAGIAKHALCVACADPALREQPVEPLQISPSP
jgi:hypothetical protein